MKSKTKVIIIILILLIIIGFIGFKMVLNSFDQINFQYRDEVKPSNKRTLDFSPFTSALESMDSMDNDNISKFIEADSFSILQEAIKNGDLSCEDVVLYYLNKIQKNDMNYNSVIQLNPTALDTAKKLDAKISRGETPSDLFGAVVLIKDNISESNMNTAAGSYALRNLTTKRDSFIVERLKSKDAIILGKCNLSEWSNFISLPSSNGFSVLGGQTKNAYGEYDVGGSSSGSSVAAALNFCTFTLGSETAGSLIYPAGQNSVVAIKPTVGALSRDLIIPITEAQDTAGIIARNTADAYKFYLCALGIDDTDPLSVNADIISKTAVANLNGEYLKGKKIGILKETSKRYDNLKKELSSAGAEVIDITIDVNSLDIDYMPVLYYGIVNDVESFLNNPDVESEFKSLKEIYDFNLKDPDNRIPYGASLHKMALEKNKTKEEIDQLIKENRAKGSTAIENILNSKDIVAIASFSNDLSALYAPALCPAVTVPGGYTSTGEPYGVTFVSKLNDDINLINVAYSYELATQNRKAPVLQN